MNALSDLSQSELQYLQDAMSGKLDSKGVELGGSLLSMFAGNYLPGSGIVLNAGRSDAGDSLASRLQQPLTDIYKNRERAELKSRGYSDNEIDSLSPGALGQTDANAAYQKTLSGIYGTSYTGPNTSYGVGQTDPRGYLADGQTDPTKGTRIVNQGMDDEHTETYDLPTTLNPIQNTAKGYSVDNPLISMALGGDTTNSTKAATDTTSSGSSDLGSFLSNLLGGGGSTSGGSSTGNTNGGLGSLVSGLLGLYSGNKGLQGANSLNDSLNSLSNMFSEDSPYATTLRNQLNAKDAASGRRSQYGPREVELQSQLASKNSSLQASIAAARLAAQQYTNGQRNTTLGAGTSLGNSLISALGGKGLSGLSSLFGGSGSTDMTGFLTSPGSSFGGSGGNLPDVSSGLGSGNFDSSNIFGGGGDLGSGTWNGSGFDFGNLGSLF